MSCVVVVITITNVIRVIKHKKKKKTSYFPRISNDRYNNKSGILVIILIRGKR